MPENSAKNDKPHDRPEDAAKKPVPVDKTPSQSGGKAKSSAREARLAEALRHNLRRRKAPTAKPVEPESEKED